MNLLEAFVETSVAGMVGLTILHSLWQGAIVAAALGVILLTVQSPRIRYAASCVAMVLIVIVCGLTLVRLLPDVAEGRQAVQAPFFLAWGLQPAIEAVNAPNRGLAAIAPWLAPFWVAGVGPPACGMYSAGYRHGGFAGEASVVLLNAGGMHWLN